MSVHTRKFFSVEALALVGFIVSLLFGFTTLGNSGALKWAFLAMIVLLLGSQRRLAPQGHPFRWLLVAVLGVCFGSSLYSPEAFYSVQLAVALTLVFTGALLLSCGQARGRKMRNEIQLANRVERLAWGFVLSAIFLFVPGLLFLGAGIEQPPLLSKPLHTGLEMGWQVRYAGILGNPNQLGICAAIFAPVVFVKALEAPRKRFLCWMLLGVIAYSVWISGSRNGLLSAGFGCAVVIIMSGVRNRLVRFGAAAGTVVLMGVLNSGALTEFFVRSEEGAITIEEVGSNRFPRWTAAVESISKRPLLGQGFGVGGVPRSGYVHPSAVDEGYPLHNSYLQITQEVGLLGLIVVGAVLIYCLGSSLNPSHWVSKNAQLRYNFAGFMGAATAGICSAIFESWLIAPGNLGTLPFWCACGVVVSVSKRPGSRSRSQKRFRPRGASREVRTPGWTGSGQNAEGKQGRKSHRG